MLPELAIKSLILVLRRSLKPGLIVPLIIPSLISSLILDVQLQQPAMAADYNKDIIYQIFTDRFFNGRSDNDDPAQSPGLFDESHKNWKAYWGGDLAGIKAKLDYVKDLGCTAIWISPVIDNENKPINDDSGKMGGPYHGYHARDFLRIEEHFGDPTNSFVDFDSLIDAAHKKGIKVFVDMPFNHTSPYNHGEYGALYNSGQFRGDVENDRNKYFNHLSMVTDYNNRFQLQYHTIFYLGDLNQENPYIDNYLKMAAQKLRSHGADGTRLDAAKHANWAWEQTLANMFYSRGDHLVMGEWWMSNTADPLYPDAVKFANKGGISLFDFPLAMALRNAFKNGGEGGLDTVAETIAREDHDFYDSRGLLTFLDNHDVPRFLSLNKDKQMMSLALSLLFTCRGIPIVYYGTEQYLHDDTAGGEDPYNRQWMSSFDQNTDAYKLIQRLSRLRTLNKVFSEGAQHTVQAAKNVYVFTRQAGELSALVAINKGSESINLNDLKTALPDGTYEDKLEGVLKGGKITVNGGLASLTLPPASFAVWTPEATVTATNTSPWISSLRPPAVSSGTPVTVYGHGFGCDTGVIKVGGEKLPVASWSDEAVSFNAPYHSSGPLSVVVTKAGAGNQSQSSSQTATLSVVEKKVIPVRFVLDKPPLQNGEQLFLTGSCATLGNGKTTWQDAAGPMIFSDDENKYILCLPMPAGLAVDVNLVVLDKDGKVIKSQSVSQRYAVPSDGTARVDLHWQD